MLGMRVELSSFLSNSLCHLRVWVSCTYGLGVDRVHGEEQRRDESQAGVFKHAAFTRVHEEAGYSAVQTHVDDVEVERRHAVQQDVQPDRQRRDTQRGGINESCVCCRS